MSHLVLKRPQHAACALVTTLLVACGGGGGGSSTSAGGTPNTGTPSNPGSPAGPATPASSWPSNGYYHVVLHPGGAVTSSSSMTTALSLVHPAAPTQEFVVDATPVANPALGLLLKQGSFDPAGYRFNNVQSVAYVDAPNDTVRITLLAANGARPQVNSVPAGGLATCADPQSLKAYNFSQPLASQFVIATAGSDSRCGTADDGQALVNFSPTGVPAIRAETNGKRLGFFRSKTDGQPSQWVLATPKGGIQLLPFSTGTPTVAVAESTSTIATQTFTPLVNTGDLLVFSQNGVLKSINPTGQVQTHVSTVGSQSWQALGADTSYAFVYRNSGTASASTTTWQVIPIGRADQKTYPAVSGAGYVATADTSNNAIYASVIYPNATAAAVKIDKQGVWTASTLFTPRSDAVVVVSPLTARANLVTTQGLQSGSQPVADIRDASSGVVLDNYGASLPFGQESSQFDPAKAQFVPTAWFMASLDASKYLGGSSVKRFDTVANQGSGGKSYITLPDGAALGGVATDVVFASAVLPEGGMAGLSALRVDRFGSLQWTGKGTYLLSTTSATAGALTRTTEQVR